MKKNVVPILLVISLVVICIIGSCANINTETITVNSTAVTSHVIVIDAGHGKPDEGDYLLKFVVWKLQIAINQQKQ